MRVFLKKKIPYTYTTSYNDNCECGWTLDTTLSSVTGNIPGIVNDAVASIILDVLEDGTTTSSNVITPAIAILCNKKRNSWKNPRARTFS